jgi:hypothetical protein
MKPPKILLALLFCLVFGGAASASAVTADFAGYCTLTSSSTTADCSFHAQYDTAEADPSSCPGSWISRIDWDFGDGTGAQNANVFATHSYPDALNLGSVTVWVTVTCGDNSYAETPRHVVFVNLGCYRCINMNNGWD